MNSIRLNDESEYPVTFFGEADGVLSGQIRQDLTVPETAGIFSDPEITCHIDYLIDTPEGPQVVAEYDGYTCLIGILKDRYNGFVMIQLIHGEAQDGAV